jgi:hypothetical protein
MNLEAWGVRLVPIKGPEWVLVGATIAAVAVIVWETWETKMGNDRPLLRVAVGIMLSFLGGMSVERGIEFFQSDANTRRWVVDVLGGFVSLAMSIFYILRRKAPRGVIEWLNERNKPQQLLEKKDS